ncbi:hypothetical protein [Pedobacter endophyticus]|uniref:Uncharacterized protein n=1 Tax=Pedobacter endophyticus TaxID=2789740 RepID=A0A7S9L0Q8_9SPHI|nr:hypothetical protein [Pedobacter endophyticus]QPH40382.1 hypothetical protein IZT61_03630 [Pedobacter endophyticus]
MSSTSETGHAKNVANFKTLLTFITGFGNSYNPSNESITLAILLEKSQKAQAVMEELNNLQALYANAIAARTTSFAPLKKLSTRLLNALKATNVSQATIEAAAGNNRKLQGKRASAIPTEAEKEALSNDGTTVNNISASQQGYDNQLNFLDKQIKLLQSIPEYAPNEAELQIASLTSLYNDLLQKNLDVVTQTAAMSQGRLKRDEILYHAESGIVALASDVKNYVKSIFGAQHPQYLSISNIAFKTSA